jgi:hypothetical protein
MHFHPPLKKLTDKIVSINNQELTYKRYLVALWLRMEFIKNLKVSLLSIFIIKNKFKAEIASKNNSQIFNLIF